MTVLLQQFIFTNDPETVNQFCEDEERPYFHFDTRNAAKELKQFQRAKNKSRSSFEKLLDCHGLSNLEKSIQQTSCDDITFETLLEQALNNNKILSKKNFSFNSYRAKFRRERKQLTKLRKLYSLMSDLEKIAIGRGKELPNLSVELIIQLSTLKNQK
ncbi:hypothetical protein M0813_10229 [Anaeramoeba flamelloides]|uniref:Uncharacterized protein n=1 Tax=Anaeramoeba flamelloides TaxID=1746091 RepID=A0AAV7ZKA8_9EUKA|nr:hypothetical protein M0812_16331 [Anaeramoeba flamelloides]KAJ6227076.1 hypothetical protein M0813_10229 [Anaeramoeba flamelloides]